MLNFSSMGDFFGDKLKTVDEVCEKHGTNLVTAFDKSPVCLECATEKRDQEVEEMRIEMTNRHLKRTTYDWLANNSILLDDTLKEASFDTFDTVDKETTENKEKALNIAREYYKGATYNTILTGK